MFLNRNKTWGWRISDLEILKDILLFSSWQPASKTTGGWEAETITDKIREVCNPNHNTWRGKVDIWDWQMALQSRGRGILQETEFTLRVFPHPNPTSQSPSQKTKGNQPKRQKKWGTANQNGECLSKVLAFPQWDKLPNTCNLKEEIYLYCIGKNCWTYYLFKHSGSTAVSF